MHSQMLQRLSKERQRVWSDYRHALETFEERSATAETRQELDRMDNHLTELDRRIKQVKDGATREDLAAGFRSSGIVGRSGDFGDRSIEATVESSTAFADSALSEAIGETG